MSRESRTPIGSPQVPKKRILLISNSTNHGTGYLEHCSSQITAFLGKLPGYIAFVPYALADWDGYEAKAAAKFKELGYELRSVHKDQDPLAVLVRASAIFIGGGNTFRLLSRLYGFNLIDSLRRRVASGIPYIGTSAGSNVACPTIKTTNDMPIVYPPTFDALGLVPFQLNPHYLDPDPTSTHKGETREERLAQYHEENDLPVVGLREGSMLLCELDKYTLLGPLPARLFKKGQAPVELSPSEVTSYLS